MSNPKPKFTLAQWCQLTDLIDRPRRVKECPNWGVVRRLIQKGYAKQRGDYVFYTNTGLAEYEAERPETDEPSAERKDAAP